MLLAQRSGHHAVAGRRLDRKDATITAAGATVAVIGTAAIVRAAAARAAASPERPRDRRIIVVLAA